MEDQILKSQLCKGVESWDIENEGYHKVEKVLAPFLRTLKKKKKVRADVVAERYKELYLKNSPRDLLLRLQSSFLDPLGPLTLLNETAELLRVVTKSKNFNVYLTDYEKGEILLCPKHVSNNERFERRYRIETGTYLAAYVASTKEYILSSDLLGDVRFPEGIPGLGNTVKSVICVPVVTNVNDDCVGIVELYRDCSGHPYDLVNLQICTALTAWMGIGVELNNVKTKMMIEMEIQGSISKIAKLYFSQAITFDKLVSDIMKILKVAIKCEKGRFYLFYDSVALNEEEPIYAEAYVEGLDENENSVLYRKRSTVKFAKNESGIPGFTARSGEVINIKDAYKDNRFDRKTETPSFRTRSILSFPIKNDKGVLAVIMLINKLSNPYFRKEDIDLINSHANSLCLFCEHHLLHRTHKKMVMRSIEVEKLLSFYTRPSLDDITALKFFLQGDQTFPSGFFKFDWDPTPYEDDCIKYIFSAFFNSDFFDPLPRFEHQNLADFLLRLKKTHRPVHYHNFEHSFAVFHCTYIILAKNKDVYSTFEKVTILLASLCHNVDHSGFTNTFMSIKNENIYQLHGDFCGEAHRYEVTAYIIQATEILSHIPPEQFQTMLKNLKRHMLAFDLAVHFQNRRKVFQLLNSNTFKWEDLEHRFLSQNMILIASEYCHVFKNFEVVQKFCSNFYKELHQQGDLEKSMDMEPLPMFDRNKTDSIPEHQIIFITIISLPVVEVLIELFPNLSALSTLVHQNLDKWREFITMAGQEMWKLSHALVTDKKDKKNHRVSVTSAGSASIRTYFSVK